MEASPWRRWVRIVAVVLLLAAIAAAHSHFDLTDRERLRAWRAALSASGIAGLCAFAAAMSAAILVYLPAWPLIGLAVAVHGRVTGALISLVSAVVAVTVSFVVVRTVGGTPLATVPWPFAQRLLGQLDAAPVRTVFLLRLCVSMNAIVNYSLALSRVSFTAYLVGSALGLVAPVCVQAWVLGAFLE